MYRIFLYAGILGFGLINCGNREEKHHGCACFNQDDGLAKSAEAVELSTEDVVDVLELTECRDLGLQGVISLTPTGLLSACDPVEVEDSTVMLYLENGEFKVKIYLGEDSESCGKTLEMGSIMVSGDFQFFLEESGDIWSAGYDEDGYKTFEAILSLDGKGAWTTQSEIWGDGYEGSMEGVETDGLYVPRDSRDACP